MAKLIRLRVLRAERDISQRALAQRINISADRLWRIENGFQDPTPVELRRLARYFKVAPDDIVPSPSPEAVAR